MSRDLRLEAVVGEITKQIVEWARKKKTGSLTFELHFKQGALPQKNMKVMITESVLIVSDQ